MNQAVDVNQLFDHTRFVELHAALLERLDQQAAEAEIDVQLAALHSCLQQQFAREELAMREAGLSVLEPHKKHHDHALSKLAQRIALWQRERNRVELLSYLEKELAEWFVSHVNIRDYMTARHFAL
jgi:hemerythrin-like metal-binding protein